MISMKLRSFSSSRKTSVYVRPKCRRYGVKHQINNQSRKGKNAILRPLLRERLDDKHITFLSTWY